MVIKSIAPLLNTLKLLLPALIPSWRFFDQIAPSPRIEYTLLETENSGPCEWREFRPRSAHLSFGGMIKRMFWNPWRNENLFLVSCAERLMANPTAHSETEIQNRIVRDLNGSKKEGGDRSYLKFRLVFLFRQGSEIHKRVLYEAAPHLISENMRS